MRALTTQTVRAIEQWLDALKLAVPPGVHLVMGGDTDDAWIRTPDADTVIIGTQDLLLSRALNRGFAMSRFAWPMAFGLLNNDVQWVFDEVQLMGVGATTSAQLAGLRASLQTFGGARSLWMSATLDTGRLTTVDLPQPRVPFVLTAAERAELAHLLDAHKAVARLDVDGADTKAIAKLVRTTHVAGTKTLLVVNTVRRAQELFTSLQTIAGDAHVALLHSRFRPADREALEASVLSRDWCGIIVATQVIEAGIDCSARTLVTDLAPWASFVQRCGRCNRYGEAPDAQIIWIDRADREAPPYAPAELAEARERISTLTSASPTALSAVTAPAAGVTLPVIRRRDVIDLFDTTQDLAGADIDVSPFIRDADDADVFVAWRELSNATDATMVGTDPDTQNPQKRGRGPTGALRLPSREELCRVPIGDAREFLKLLRAAGLRAWRWDHRESAWQPVDNAVPGQVWIVPCEAGGYSPARGFHFKSEARVPEILASEIGTMAEGDVDDPLTMSQRDESLEEHTRAVVAAMTDITDRVPLVLASLRDQLVLAAQWHDVGKAHPVFQDTMYGETGASRPLLGKSARGGKHARRAFRHEVASALAVMHSLPDHFLVPYLVAAHHGKARMVVRARPGEKPPADARRFALGVHDGDELPEVRLGAAMLSPKLTLDLAVFSLGGDGISPGWTARSAELRDAWGPFRLAYLETMLRCADWRASSMGAPT